MSSVGFEDTVSLTISEMLPDLENPLWGVVSEREIFVGSLWEFGWDEFVWGFRFGEKRFEFGHLFFPDLCKKNGFDVFGRDAFEEIDVGKGEGDGHLLFFAKAFDFGAFDEVREEQVMAELATD